MAAEWLFLGMLTLLTVAAGYLTISGLKLLQRIDAYFPPSGASRMPMQVRRGNRFPMERLPKDLQAELAGKPVVFVFLSPNCSVCLELLPSLPALVRSYRQYRFIVCSRSTPVVVPGARALTGDDLFEYLRIGLIPYVVKIERDQVVEFGVVNSLEHVESILIASWEGDEI